MLLIEFRIRNSDPFIQDPKDLCADGFDSFLNVGKTRKTNDNTRQNPKAKTS